MRDEENTKNNTKQEETLMPTSRDLLSLFFGFFLGAASVFSGFILANIFER